MNTQREEAQSSKLKASSHWLLAVFSGIGQIFGLRNASCFHSAATGRIALTPSPPFGMEESESRASLMETWGTLSQASPNQRGRLNPEGGIQKGLGISARPTWSLVIGHWSLVIAALVPLAGCLKPVNQSVVIYTSQDQVYSEPLLADFGREFALQVRPVFDSEAVKTVGLVNRLLAERQRPQADVFWNNEALRSHQLAAAGVFAPTNGFVAFGQRSRRLVINTNLVSLAEAPRTFSELTNVVWRGRVALGYPLFGTTATHFLALRQHWGHDRWLDWCRALAANQPFLLDGNSQVVKLVGRGEAAVGMTDSDDITAAQRAGLPVVALPMGAETLLIPNTAGVVVGGPNPAAGRRLVEFLQSPRVVDALIAAGALERVDPGSADVVTLQADWPALLRDLDAATGDLKGVFLRK